MMMNERQLIEYVLKLVRRVITEKRLVLRPKAIVVIKALGLPPPYPIKLQNGTDGARCDRQILLSDRLTCWERIEFTLFHELLHILIEEDEEVLSQLLEHFYHRSDADRNHALENLCNIGAAEFMMPASEFAEIMRAGEWRLEALAVAAQRFEASIVACGFQFAHHNPDRCILVICEQGMVSRKEQSLAILEEVSSRACLHVAYTAYHPDEENRMCRFASVPSDHPINHAWNNKTAMTCKAIGFFSTPKMWKISCEIAYIGNRVYAAYYPKERKYQSNQPSLFEN